MQEGWGEWLPEYITTGDVAGYCGVSKVTVLRWIKKGYLEAFRLPEGHYRVHRDSFGEFLNRYDMSALKRIFKRKRGSIGGK